MQTWLRAEWPSIIFTAPPSATTAKFRRSLTHRAIERRSKILLADYFLTGSKYFAHNVGLA